MTSTPLRVKLRPTGFHEETQHARAVHRAKHLEAEVEIHFTPALAGEDRLERARFGYVGFQDLGRDAWFKNITLKTNK